MEKLISIGIVLTIVIILTLAFSPIIHLGINADIASSNHYGDVLDAEALGVLAIAVELHGLFAIIGEVVGAIARIYKTYT